MILALTLLAPRLKTPCSSVLDRGTAACRSRVNFFPKSPHHSNKQENLVCWALLVMPRHKRCEWITIRAGDKRPAHQRAITGQPEPTPVSPSSPVIRRQSAQSAFYPSLRSFQNLLVSVHCLSIGFFWRKQPHTTLHNPTHQSIACPANCGGGFRLAPTRRVRRDGRKRGGREGQDTEERGKLPSLHAAAARHK